jgi:hypothetical protein
MQLFEPYINQLSDMLETLRDVLSDLEAEEDSDKDALSTLYDAEAYLEQGIAELKQ